ncbi:MAG TPA: cobaltochelatase subunit CobT, partial [Alphaproteobacteria bacterium]|nr:cobaltochelatase subunit CobT [Alphaproteobacteria bacterium]
MSKQDTESPVEPFKRALTSAVRSIAEEPELQVSFGTEPTGVRGDQVRLPLPPRDLPADEVARIRGAADACSLRLRHHDDNLHRRHAPMGPTAREVYEAA